MEGLWESFKKTAIDVKNSAVKAMNEATDYPSTMHCSNMQCEIMLSIPPTAFEWKCKDMHVNDKNAKVCSTCQGPKPTNLPEPKIKCAQCQQITSVPFTNAKKDVLWAAQQAKKEYEYAKARPEQFHCAHCDKMLATPKGPWTCQTCQTVNEENIDACTQCQQKQSEQKVLCGVCGRSTKIPSMNLLDKVNTASRRLTKQTEKAYYDVRGFAYVKCPQCEKAVSVPKAAEAKQVGEGKQQVGEPAAALEGGEGSGSVICPKCRMVLTYTPPQQGVKDPNGAPPPYHPEGETDPGAAPAGKAEGTSTDL